jgi:hypothetical protein
METLAYVFIGLFILAALAAFYFSRVAHKQAKELESQNALILDIWHVVTHKGPEEAHEDVKQILSADSSLFKTHETEDAHEEK